MDLGSSHLSTTFWSSELKYGDSDLLRVGGYVWAVLYRHTPDDEKSYVWTKMHYNVILESIWILPKNLINMVTRKLNFTLPEERETRGNSTVNELQVIFSTGKRGRSAARRPLIILANHLTVAIIHQHTTPIAAPHVVMHAAADLAA